MARPKKTDDKLKAAPMPVAAPHMMMPPQQALHPSPLPTQTHIAPVMPHQLQQVQALQQPHIPQPRVIDGEQFARVRDSAIGRLQVVSELLRTFTQEYVRQTSLLLGEPTADLGQDNLLSNSFDQTASLLLGGGLSADLAAAAAAAEPEKKERKKRTHDPNAPKRPLTPYFLYMQHARSIIANDLGAEAPKGAVQEEGQRRWANMSPQEKQGWNNAYQYNLRLYNARVHSYKSGNPMAKEMSDDDALKYADDFQIPMPEIKEAAAPTEVGGNEQDAITQQLQGTADEAKTPKKTAPKGKRKSTAATPALEDKATPAMATPVTASPDKKRRRTSTKAPDAAEEPKKSNRKKTKSS